MPAAGRSVFDSDQGFPRTPLILRKARVRISGETWEHPKSKGDSEMSYKTISTVLTQPDRDPTHLDCAAQLSGMFEAHLDILCAGIDSSRPELAFPDSLPALDQALLAVAKDATEKMTQKVRDRVDPQTQPHEVIPMIVTPGGLQTAIAANTVMSDLVVLPRPYGELTRADDETVAEAALFNGPTPVLFCPLGTSTLDLSGPVVVGWNESAQALAAVRAALPFLQQASSVHITLVAPSTTGSDRSDPGGKLARMLARHGVKAEVWVLAQTLPRASDELMRHAREVNATMMVMGAYSHSRLREAVFGGATRSMLKSAELPLLMAR